MEKVFKFIHICIELLKNEIKLFIILFGWFLIFISLTYLIDGIDAYQQINSFIASTPTNYTAYLSITLLFILLFIVDKKSASFFLENIIASIFTSLSSISLVFLFLTLFTGENNFSRLIIISIAIFLAFSLLIRLVSKYIASSSTKSIYHYSIALVVILVILICLEKGNLI